MIEIMTDTNVRTIPPTLKFIRGGEVENPIPSAIRPRTSVAPIRFTTHSEGNWNSTNSINTNENGTVSVKLACARMRFIKLLSPSSPSPIWLSRRYVMTRAVRIKTDGLRRSYAFGIL